MLEEKKILNDGFVRLIRVDGTDQDIVQAARQSYTNKGELRTSQQDQKLIDYLMRHRHTSPFEMVDMVFQIKCPIFVARQWVRHRTASLNEYSGRYSEMPAEYYVPDVDRVQAQSKTNKQGSDGLLPEEVRRTFADDTNSVGEGAFELYDWHLQDGVSRELARINLPLTTYTVFTWKMDLHNLLHFLKLRADNHSQYEIRVFAEAILEMVGRYFPMTYSAFREFEMDSVKLSASSREAVRVLLQHHRGLLEASLEQEGVGERERREVLDVFCL